MAAELRPRGPLPDGRHGPFGCTARVGCSGLLARHRLVALAKRHTATILGKSVMDLHPWGFRAHHEMKTRLARRVGVEGAESEAENLGTFVLALVDRGATAAGEEAVYARARLPA